MNNKVDAHTVISNLAQKLADVEVENAMLKTQLEEMLNKQKEPTE